jgi:hypothetical protein
VRFAVRGDWYRVGDLWRDHPDAFDGIQVPQAKIEMAAIAEYNGSIFREITKLPMHARDERANGLCTIMK